jgi:L-lactate dehydrogenase complex protein LldG
VPRVGLFIPCYMDAFEPEVGIATLDLPERLGCIGSSETDSIALLRERLRGPVICSAAPEIASSRRLDEVKQPRDLADVDAAVVRALVGVAETGTVLLTEEESVVNTLAYLAERLVVLLDPEDIVSGIQNTYDRSEFHRAAYAVFHTGPSATGDIEGVLIHPAQGVRTLTVAVISRSVARGADLAVGRTYNSESAVPQ